MPFEAIEVEGLKELETSLRVLSADARSELQKGLIRGAEPVKKRAADLALSEITNMTVPWSGMRVGSTSALVYIAPKQHGARQPQRKRPNLAKLLMDRAMLPALHQKRADVEVAVSRALDRALARAGF